MKPKTTPLKKNNDSIPQQNKLIKPLFYPQKPNQKKNYINTVKKLTSLKKATK